PARQSIRGVVIASIVCELGAQCHGECRTDRTFKAREWSLLINDRRCLASNGSHRSAYLPPCAHFTALRCDLIRATAALQRRVESSNDWDGTDQPLDET